MYRILLVFSIVVLSGTISFSQEFDGGITAGLVTSQVDGDSWAGYNKSGFTFGAFVSRKLSEKIGAGMEIRYIRKGALKDDTGEDGFTYYRSRLNYIEIPLYLRYYSGRFLFEAGPSIGVLVNSSEDDLYGEIPIADTKEFNQMEISGLAGFSYVVTDNILISFRMQYSLLPIRTNLSDNIQVQFYHQKYSFNNLMSFSMYYKL